MQVGDTSWHPDHAINYNAPGCRFAFYLDDLSADTGALRIIPRSHAPPLHSFLHKAHQQCGAPGHTDGGLATALGCARDEDIPAHVISSRPGDLTIFDQAAFRSLKLLSCRWFLLHMCEVPTCEDEGTRQLALDALEGSLQLGWDAGYGGGLLYMMDVLGKPMVDATVTKDGKLCEWLHLRTACAHIT